MGNGYKQNLHLQQRSTFLPMLCSSTSSSIKDATFPRWENRSMSFSDDPLSPKIGCMGQVKRSNRIVGFPSSSSSNNNNQLNTTISSVKYSKLRKIFSARNLTNTIPSTTTTTTTTTASTFIPNNNTTNYRRRELMTTLNSDATRGSKTFNGRENPHIGSISIEEMDPPLPVIKKVHKPVDGGEVDSLWKRRCGGVSLTNLQLQQIQRNRHNNSLALTNHRVNREIPSVR